MCHFQPYFLNTCLNTGSSEIEANKSMHVRSFITPKLLKISNIGLSISNRTCAALMSLSLNIGLEVCFCLFKPYVTVVFAIFLSLTSHYILPETQKR